jgi:hypothetical protein
MRQMAQARQAMGEAHGRPTPDSGVTAPEKGPLPVSGRAHKGGHIPAHMRRTARKQRMAVYALFVEQSVKLLFDAAADIGILNSGRVVAEGSAAAVKATDIDLRRHLASEREQHERPSTARPPPSLSTKARPGMGGPSPRISLK